MLSVLQSCPSHERHGWLARCMHSVEQWAAAQGFSYRWIDDELFDLLPADLQPGQRISPVIASDIARLIWMQQRLHHGDKAVLWLDADVLVIQPEQLMLPSAHAAVGREVWVQAEPAGGWRVYRKVHNAALLARDQGAGRNSFIDFYLDTAQRLVRANAHGMPAQFVGPKLLTALHNVVQFAVMEDVGMLSPAVVADLLHGGGGALKRMLGKSTRSMHAANLCRSSTHAGDLDDEQMLRLVDQLLAHPASVALA